MIDFIFVDEKTEWLANLGIAIANLYCISNSKHDIIAIVEKINNSLNDKPEIVVFINIERPFIYKSAPSKEAVNYHLQNCIGIELFKQLRIKGMKNHIVLYGFLPLHWILKLDKINAIINTKGCTYLQLPFGSEMLDRELYTEKSDEAEFKSVLRRGAFNIDAFRHSKANYWALDKTLVCFEHIQPNNGLEVNYINSVGEPDIITKNEINEAKFVFGESNGVSSVVLKNDSVTLLKKIRTRSQYTNIFYFDDQHKIGWDKLFASLLFGDTKNKKYVEKFDHYFPHGNDKSGLYVFSENYEQFNNIETRKELLLKAIKEKLPDLFIIDLRLTQNDQTQKSKDIKKISGYKLFKFLHCEFPGTPVLIISASDKTYTSKALLENGASAYWMKEGADVGYSFEDSFENFNQLLSKLNKLTDFDFRIVNTLFTFHKAFCNDIQKYLDLRSKPDFSYINNYLTNNDRATINAYDVENNGPFQRPILEKIQIAFKQLKNKYNYPSDAEIDKNWSVSRLIKQVNTIEKVFNQIEWNEARKNSLIEIFTITVDFLKTSLVTELIKFDKSNAYSSVLSNLGEMLELLYGYDLLVTNIEDRKLQGYKTFLLSNDFFAKFLYEYRNYASHFETSSEVDEFVLSTYVICLYSYFSGKTQLFKDAVFVKTDGTEKHTSYKTIYNFSINSKAISIKNEGIKDKKQKIIIEKIDGNNIIVKQLCKKTKKDEIGQCKTCRKENCIKTQIEENHILKLTELRREIFEQ